MNNPLVIFLSLFVTLAIFQLLLLLYLANKKIKTNKKLAHEQAIYAEAMPAYIQYLNSDPNESIPLPPDEYHVAEQLFSDCMAIIKDEKLQNNVRESASSYLSSHYEKVMKTRDWSSRVNALYYMEDFRMTSLQPLLSNRLKEVHTNDEETQQLIRTLAAMGDLSVLTYLENEPESTESMYLSVFSRLPEDVVPKAIDYVNKDGSLKAKTSLLMYFGLAKNLAYLPFVEEKLHDENSSLQIQALKAIFRMNYISDANLLTPFFKSDNWIERMFAVKIAGVLSLSQFEHILVELLGDPIWWVRYYTADALLLTFGENKLKEISKSHPDHFARDMASQWLTLGRQVTQNE